MNDRSAGATWDRIASRYDKRFGPEYRRLIEKICGELGPDDAVVEIACGTGLVAYEAAAKCRSVLGIDLSGAMIAVANRKKTDSRRTNVEFRIGDAMDLSRETGRYDAAVLCNMLHVVENPRKVLMETRTLLKPSGRIILATYCHGEASRIQDRIFSLGMRLLHRVGRIPFLYILGFRDVFTLCADAGLAVEKSSLLTGEDFPCAFIVARAWSPDLPRFASSPSIL